MFIQIISQPPEKNSIFPLSCSWYETLTCFATFSENKKDFPSSILQHLGTINLGSHIFWVNVSNNLYSSSFLYAICGTCFHRELNQNVRWSFLSASSLSKMYCSQDNLMAHVPKSIFSSYVISSICHHLIL